MCISAVIQHLATRLPVSLVLLLGLATVNAVAAAEPEPEGQPAVRLESTFTGDKEQPAVSYFIPWQGTSTPDKLQWNIADSHDGTLRAIDRHIMVRSMNMYNEMNLENQ